MTHLQCAAWRQWERQHHWHLYFTANDVKVPRGASIDNGGPPCNPPLKHLLNVCNFHLLLHGTHWTEENIFLSRKYNNTPQVAYGAPFRVYQMCHCSVLCMTFTELKGVLWCRCCWPISHFCELPFQAPPKCPVCLSSRTTSARTSLLLVECHHIVSDEGHQITLAIVRSKNAVFPIHFSRAERIFCSQHPKIPTDSAVTEVQTRLTFASHVFRPSNTNANSKLLSLTSQNRLC